MFRNIIKKINCKYTTKPYYYKNYEEIPCKNCIFYIKPIVLNNIEKGLCAKYLDIKKDPLNEIIAKKKYCDNNPKYFIY